tara:strand:- start:2587 stop:3924 length:1338 start_codon:yes stop_codon:yes gene_type:complete
MKKPLFIIAGTNSGCGKTTVTLGIIQSLVKKNLKTAAFKIGPDYIDPSYHKAITAKPGCNLDSWMMRKETICYLINKNMELSDIGVIEGVMGLYDGISGNEYPKGSSAHIAEILQIPIILVVNAKGLAHSIVPIINGFKIHGKKIKFLGVILNHIGSDSHYKMLKQLIENDCKLPCFGFIKKLGFKLPERHLGLVPFQELDSSNLILDEITENIDIDLILKESAENSIVLKTSPKKENKRYDLTLAVARDDVFSFYYEDNLDVLKEQGVQLKFFSPVEDKSLPENIDGIYFGGGFPEIFAKNLLSNKTIMDNIREKFKEDIPIYAECGGLIYVFETLIDHDNNKCKMVGLIKGTVKMEHKKQALGYYEAKLNNSDLPLLRGHQFHYSRVIDMDDPEVLPLYQTKKPSQKNWNAEGYRKQNLIASYLHLHFRDQMEFVHYFLKKCK